MVASTAGFKGTVTEVQEATRFALAVTKAIVDTPSSFKPTPTGVRSVQLAAGTAMVCGVLIVESAAQLVQVAVNAGAAPRLDVVGLRFTWAGDNSRVEVFVKQGVVGSTTPPALTRVAGGTYEMPIAVVRARPSVSTIAAADVLDVRVWGGYGGPFQAAQTELLSIVDLPLGAVLQSGPTEYNVTANDGQGNSTLSLTSAASLPWTAYDPVLKSNDGVVNLGAGGLRRGYYQLDPATQTCHVKFELRTGTGTRNFGRGPLTVDLPAGIRPSAVFTDQWGDGLMNTHVGDGFYNWQVKYLIRNDQNNFVVTYVSTAGNDCRLLPARSSDDSGGIGNLDQPGTGGVPYLEAQNPRGRVYSEPNVLTGAFSYVVA
ncbi:hypothetical protein IM25_22665 [Rhodococcus sp. p52]|uniref:hypothetical protein n=1 Tax=Rhodococcus sp. p52 TaxID=935199 RepID=UPI00051A856C|nr:hypothetical protein [Rhodococcus sp. p52]AOD24036.1 hypothetical protein IM25_22665 [Rhodococcus sp. p52]